ncbi:solute carrier family 25 member 35 [Zeugodacus cucurbitae]|uniref:Solute carrier family 25 member 35 n=1 Tax=Zeugodacus cucurbitae TaxID=28588 RepID=A0A0A1X550_ZEUCU|nr:solute carrier family 25 member 35 [Zeugodacus cucurbitae]
MSPTYFLAGGVASVCAICITNPLEVVKIRMQLQGELAAPGTYDIRYRNTMHALVTIVKNEGWTGLQKGLVPAMNFQFILNSIRLGFYHTAVRNQWTSNKSGGESFGKNLLLSISAGAVGAYFSSPFFMIKTQMQSEAPAKVAVGYQHHHVGMLNAMRKIYAKNGIAGLWRGSFASIPRASIGSGAQIATFAEMKALLREHNLVVQPSLNTVCGGFLAGLIVSVTITPPDVIATRLYNQGVDAKGRGLFYNGWLDCASKITRIEGAYGLYKGFWTTYIRLTPQSILILLFFDELIALKNRL